MIHSNSVAESDFISSVNRRHHLFIRTGQVRQIGAPKTALRAEGVDDAAHQRM